MSTNSTSKAGLANAQDTVSWRSGTADDPLLPRLIHVEFPAGSAQECVERRARIIEQHQGDLDAAIQGVRANVPGAMVLTGQAVPTAEDEGWVTELRERRAQGFYLPKWKDEADD